jgi:prepilin-type N-terminal cleavage/methylation domain-containing protein
MKLPTHTTFRAPGYRSAFTLVELMVVIAIIGVIVTLAASGTMQVITRQKSANTETTIQKVNDALKAHWSSVFQKANTEQIPPNILFGDSTMLGLLAMAGGSADPDAESRARLLWIKLRLKQQFPMNFMEALVPTPNLVRSGKPFVLLPPSPVYVQALLGQPKPPWPVGQIPPLKDLPAGLPRTSLAASNLPQSFEASVCLLLALSQGTGGPVGLDQDRLSSLELADAATFDPTLTALHLKVIVDAWGRPLAFYRWPIDRSGGELANSNPHKTSTIGDPLDPDGRLLSPSWNNPQAYAGRQGVWAFEKLLHPVRDLTSKPASYYTVPVIASTGASAGTKSANQPYLDVYTFMGLPQPPPETAPVVGLPTALRHDPMALATGTPDSFDNIYSFRMRLGARGD